TTSTTAAPVTPAVTAVAGALAVTTSPPESGGKTYSASQFAALLDALKVVATPAPADAAPAPAGTEQQQEEVTAQTSDEDAAAATPAPTAAAATIAVTAATLTPAIEALVAVPLSISAHARGTKSGEAETSPVINDGVVAGEAPGTTAGPI